MKPSDFFIGVIDFFAVLVPGAVLTGVVWSDLAPVLTDRLDALGGTAMTVAFLVVSYVLGQLAYAAGSRLDPYYDRWRERSKKDDLYLDRAVKLAETEGWSEDDIDALHKYKWAEARLRIRSPSAIAAVDRAQAESKFFRTLTAVLMATAVIGFLAGRGAEVVIALALIPISITRFYKTRLDATQLAYRLYVASSVEDYPEKSLEGEAKPSNAHPKIVPASSERPVADQGVSCVPSSPGSISQE